MNEADQKRHRYGQPPGGTSLLSPSPRCMWTSVALWWVPEAHLGAEVVPSLGVQRQESDYSRTPTGCTTGVIIIIILLCTTVHSKIMIMMTPSLTYFITSVPVNFDDKARFQGMTFAGCTFVHTKNNKRHTFCVSKGMSFVIFVLKKERSLHGLRKINSKSEHYCIFVLVILTKTHTASVAKFKKSPLIILNIQLLQNYRQQP